MARVTTRKVVNAFIKAERVSKISKAHMAPTTMNPLIDLLAKEGAWFNSGYTDDGTPFIVFGGTWLMLKNPGIPSGVIVFEHKDAHVTAHIL